MPLVVRWCVGDSARVCQLRKGACSSSSSSGRRGPTGSVRALVAVDDEAGEEEEGWRHAFMTEAAPGRGPLSAEPAAHAHRLDHCQEGGCRR